MTLIIMRNVAWGHLKVKWTKALVLLLQWPVQNIAVRGVIWQDGKSLNELLNKKSQSSMAHFCIFDHISHNIGSALSTLSVHTARKINLIKIGNFFTFCFASLACWASNLSKSRFCHLNSFQFEAARHVVLSFKHQYLPIIKCIAKHARYSVTS